MLEIELEMDLKWFLTEIQIANNNTNIPSGSLIMNSHTTRAKHMFAKTSVNTAAKSSQPSSSYWLEYINIYKPIYIRSYTCNTQPTLKYKLYTKIKKNKILRSHKPNIYVISLHKRKLETNKKFNKKNTLFSRQKSITL